MKPYKTITLRLDAAHYARPDRDRPDRRASKNRTHAPPNSLWRQSPASASRYLRALLRELTPSAIM